MADRFAARLRTAWGPATSPCSPRPMRTSTPGSRFLRAAGLVASYATQNLGAQRRQGSRRQHSP